MLCFVIQYTDLDKCLAHILHDSVIYLRTIGKECDTSTMDAYEFYKEGFDDILYTMICERS